eukprot:4661245-Prymnesium_polylepis.1
MWRGAGRPWRWTQEETPAAVGSCAGGRGAASEAQVFLWEMAGLHDERCWRAHSERGRLETPGRVLRGYCGRATPIALDTERRPEAHGGIARSRARHHEARSARDGGRQRVETTSIVESVLGMKLGWSMRIESPHRCVECGRDRDSCGA